LLMIIGVMVVQSFGQFSKVSEYPQMSAAFYNYHIVFYPFYLYVVIIPIYLFLLSNYVDYVDQYKVILRFVHVKDWWKQRFIYEVILSLAYTLYIHASFIVSLLVNHIFPMGMKYLNILLYGMVLSFCGFMLINRLCDVLSLLVKNRFFSFLLTYIILLIPVTLNGLTPYDLYFIVEYMFQLNVLSDSFVWINGIKVKSIFLTFTVILSFIHYHSLKSMDIFWRK